MSRSLSLRGFFVIILWSGAMIATARGQSSANPDLKAPAPPTYGAAPRSEPDEPADDQKGRSLYENPRRLEQLSGAARSVLERRYGRKKPLSIQGNRLPAPATPELSGAI